MKTADILIQAGHEGRKKGEATGAEGALGREIDWTPIVADAATKALRRAGFSVIRAGAELKGPYSVGLALFIHFDGAERACDSGASIGYDDDSDSPAGQAWKALYSQFWPFAWQRDNFTKNLRHYYGFGHTRTVDAELVLELGEITCPAQAAWLRPRLHWLGALVAHFASERLGGSVPRPGPFKQ